jgi:hypothetical protein
MLNMAPVYFLDGEWCLRPFLLLLETWLGVSLLSHSLPHTRSSPSISSSSSSLSSIPSSSSSSSIPSTPSARAVSPSPSSPTSAFHFIATDPGGGGGGFNFNTNVLSNHTTAYHGIEVGGNDKEREREGEWGQKPGSEEDPLVKLILRVVSALFVINIGLSFINLATT